MNDKFANLQIETKDIQIPHNILVPCPISGKQRSRLAAGCCPECKYFLGLGKLVFADTEEEQAKIDKLPFAKKYAIRCNTVMEWTLTEFDV